MQTQANVQLSSPAPITTPMSIPCTSQQQNVEHWTTLSETAEIFGRAVVCNLDPTDNCEQYPAGGFSGLLQRDELTHQREENRRLQEENKMLRCKLKNQPGKKKKLFISITISIGNRTEWSPIRVWLQTKLDDTKFCYQLIIALTKFVIY